MTAFRYKAFISYSWADAAWGAWLHKAIETYRTPAALIGKAGAFGPVPARLHPLFKDREEEAAGASIGAAVEAALAASEFLIVVCSPRSAQSKWVNHELAWFKTHRNPANILALIVDGSPGGGEQECFPKALTHQVNADFSITEIPVDHPLAADARDSGDGKRKARLKLAAALLGVGLDELVRRDDRRRALRVRLVVGGSLALALAMSALALAAVRARDEADFQRAESDGLVEFMLTDLRERLEPVGRLDALDVVGQRALKYYAGQKASSLDADALGRRARALHLVGEVSNIRGDSAAGLTAFREAAATTGEQLARNPNDPKRIFDHAQSVFWVGYIAYERGELAEAESRFREYKRLADQLLAIDPGKPEWQMEVSYAESNLGILFFEQGRFAEAEQAFAAGAKMVEAVATAQPADLGRKLEVGSAVSWLGRAQVALNKTAEAEQLYRREIAIYAGILKADPANNMAKMRTAVAWQYLGGIAQMKGNVPAALAAGQTSLTIMAKLRAIEPANTEWQEIETRAMLSQADYLFDRGQLAESRVMNAAARQSIADLISSDSTNRLWSIDLWSWCEWQQARGLLQQGRPQEALAILQAIARRAAGSKVSATAERELQALEVQMLTGDAHARLGQPADARRHWQTALQVIEGKPKGEPLRIKRQQYLLLKRLGRLPDAAQTAAELDRQGYRHPAYLREGPRR